MFKGHFYFQITYKIYTHSHTHRHIYSLITIYLIIESIDRSSTCSIDMGDGAHDNDDGMSGGGDDDNENDDLK